MCASFVCSELTVVYFSPCTLKEESKMISSPLLFVALLFLLAVVVMNIARTITKEAVEIGFFDRIVTMSGLLFLATAVTYYLGW